MSKKPAKPSSRTANTTSAATKKPAPPATTNDWRTETLAQVRAIIQRADPDAAESIKWGNVPVWSHPNPETKSVGIICTGETYKTAVKLTFPNGAAIAHFVKPAAAANLFNASLEGTRRAIDIRENESINDKHLAALIKTAVKLNTQPSTTKAAAKTTSRTSRAKPKLLAGGNPQIPKGEGHAVVQQYIDAIPSTPNAAWKRDLCRRLDTLIEQAIPSVRKAVKYNSPLYAAPDMPSNNWFLGLHLYDRYVKVAFFQGAHLTPQPPDPSKQPSVRYLNLHNPNQPNTAPFNPKQFTAWIKQAAKLPGERI